nr:hypothetical protein [Tanacetum cinerariifolium]
MSILSGRKSVPGMYSRKRGKWKEKTTRSSRELHEGLPQYAAEGRPLIVTWVEDQLHVMGCQAHTNQSPCKMGACLRYASYVA